MQPLILVAPQLHLQVGVVAQVQDAQVVVAAAVAVVVAQVAAEEVVHAVAQVAAEQVVVAQVVAVVVVAVEAAEEAGSAVEEEILWHSLSTSILLMVCLLLPSMHTLQQEIPTCQ